MIDGFEQIRHGFRYVVVTVVDTGAGIAPGIVEKIFNPFFTTKEGGTGLGLSISQRIVHQHKGFFEVRQAPGKGCAFSVFLRRSRPGTGRRRAMSERSVTVVGAGLAGSEAALRLSRAGVAVDLYEMRPTKLTPAHRSGRFAELVCSNSLGSWELTSGKGLLKEELRILGSTLLPIADASRVPAGKALAVDREEFGRRVTEAVRSCPGIRVHEEEVKTIPGDPLVILACGPLASDAIASAIRGVLGDDGFYFYDAISPIVDAETIDPEASFVADRYGVGTGDYLNLPMDGTVQGVPLRPADGEDGSAPGFRGAEVLRGVHAGGGDRPARTGDPPVRAAAARRTEGPATGRIPHAVVQLRKENAAGTMYNLVGFQTRLTYPEQKRVFSLIPGLSSAGYFVTDRCTATVSSMPDGISIRGWSPGAAPASSSRARSRG